MSEYFNSLSPAQGERLFLLLEELGEAQQAIGKVLRHGYESLNPDMVDGPTNKENLERELGHVLTAIHIICERNKDMSSWEITMARDEKIRKIAKYMHHQGSA